MKILYDLNVTTTEEKQGGQRVVCVAATVRRLRLVDSSNPSGVRIEPIDEPASQVTRLISCQALEMCRAPVGFVKMEADAATDEAMRVAVRRGPHEEWPSFVGLDRAMDKYREKAAVADMIAAPDMIAVPKTYEETHYWRTRAAQELAREQASANLIASNGPSFKNLGAVSHVEEEAEIDRLCGKYPDLEAGQLRTLAAGLRHAKRRGAGSGTWCRRCGWHDSVIDGLCQRCGEAEELASILAASVCTECNGSGLSAAGGLCPTCKDLLREKDRHAPCAKCGMTVHPIGEGDGGYCSVCVESLSKIAKKRDDFWARHRAYLDRREQEKDACPECGGTGEVQLFTSVVPCSRGCRR